MPRSSRKFLNASASAILLIGFTALDSYAKAKPFAVPEAVGDADQFGAKIQRTMTLLATSTPQKRNRVRILFYGQSVSGCPWWKDVAADLRKRFPHADLEVTNKSIGGYGGHILINTAEYDLYPFYPDLVIFHVFWVYEQVSQTVQKSVASSAEHAVELAGFVVSAREVDGLPQLGERDRATIQPDRLTNSNDRRFLCAGIGELSILTFVYESGSLVPQASDGRMLAR